MRSVLSALKNGLSRAFGSEAARIVDSPAMDGTGEQPRLMAESSDHLGRALLYVPNEGLFRVNADGTTTHLRSASLLRREGKDVIFLMHFPVGENHTIRFAGPGSRSEYYHREDEGVELVELPRGSFDIVRSKDPESVPGAYRYLYKVTLR